jgi:hypothetical protein
MLLINYAIYSVLVIVVSISLCNIIKDFSITISFRNHMEVKRGNENSYYKGYPTQTAWYYASGCVLATGLQAEQFTCVDKWGKYYIILFFLFTYL